MRILSLLATLSILALAGCTPAAAPTTAPTAAPTDGAAPTSTPRTTFVARADHDGAVGMTVTLPSSGWQWDDIARGFLNGNEVKNVPEAAVLLWSWPAGTGFYVYGDPCQWVSTRPDTPATTVDAIVAGLAAQASRDASDPVDVSIGGYAAKSITLHVPDDAVFDGCDSSNFTSYGVVGDEPARYHQGPGQIDEFWVVDVDGAIMVIDATYRPDTPAELVEEMRSIAQSATFETP